MLISENRDLLAAVNGLAYWGAVSGHTQWILGQMISDEAWIDEYCVELSRALRSVFARVSTALDAAGIPIIAAGAGIFVLCDMRAFLAENTWEAEHALWRRILDEANVNITPGAACRIAEPDSCGSAMPPNRSIPFSPPLNASDDSCSADHG